MQYTKLFVSNFIENITLQITQLLKSLCNKTESSAFDRQQKMLYFIKTKSENYIVYEQRKSDWPHMETLRYP